MIDTIKGYINLTDNPIPLLPVSDFLTKPRRSISESSRTHFLRGYYKNFIFRIRYYTNDFDEEMVLNIGFEGSIPKFLYGNNLASCSPGDIESVISSFSDSFGIDFNKATITRIDFGFNFLTKKPVSYYINSIKSFKRLKKMLYEGESVSFFTRSSSLSVKFYDKIKEITDKNKSGLKILPDFLVNCNILRYEVSLKKRIKERLNLDSLSFSDLSSSSLLKSLYNELMDTLSKVVIDNIEIPSNSFVFGRGWLKDFLAMMGLKSYGYDQAISLIENQDYPVSNPAVKKSQLKKTLRELVSSTNELHKISIKRELEAKLGALYGIFI